MDSGSVAGSTGLAVAVAVAVFVAAADFFVAFVAARFLG
jgi:hypothetical protein